MKTKKDTSTDPNMKMTRTQKVIVILTVAVLAIFLIAFAATRYMGSPNIYPIDIESDTSDTSDLSSDTEKEGNGLTDTDKQNNSSDGNSNNSNNSQGGISQENDGESDNNGSEGEWNPDKPKDNEDKTPSDNDDSNSNSGNSSDSSDEPNSNDKLDGSENISSSIINGASVTVTEINESTVTVKVGGEIIIIPVQTTIFNGRITKSGVLSDSICGYSIGASIMLYYLESGFLDGVSLSGAYVKVDSTRLTVSGDYNGDGSKIILRINGAKLP